MNTETLQQVIQEIKTRGVRAGEDEGTRIVEDARKQAAEIVENARVEADGIVEGARTQTQAMRTQLEAELRQACSVGLEAFRQAVEQSFLVPNVDEALRLVLQDPTQLGEIVLAAVSGFASSGGDTNDLTVLLPAALQQKLEGSFVADLKAKAGAGVRVRFEDGLEFGFRIAGQDSGYVFDFSDEGFREILLKFMAPRFREYFYSRK